ncbi:hypothetical protein L6164_003342 [Bauhinia variegata]|uniref:Uncharacterized protein n=1 Tax=Bauhinia variegata TaxID=167791 RepID=A0ACB9Q135_BAUVA|nr:hypothetical protein L6164_003342 [Bauhinia variegata]
MVACLNPGEYQESVHTVSLAARSRRISNLVPSAHKQKTPKIKVDMEGKPRAWLESKGKTKSTRRLEPLKSPCLRKTPKSYISAKRSVTFYGSVKGTSTTNQEAAYTKERAFTVAFQNLLDDEDAFLSCLESPHCGGKANKEENECNTNVAASWKSDKYPSVKSDNKG